MSGFSGKFSRAVPAAEPAYYGAISPGVQNAIGFRDSARDAVRAGGFGVAEGLARNSLKILDCLEPPGREVYASLGMLTRVLVQKAGDRTEALAAVEEMERVDISVKEMPIRRDVYEDIFRPVRSAARFCGDWRARAKGVGIGVTGIAASPFVESERFRNFPNREAGTVWRLAKKAGFAGKNACAIGANVLGSEHLAKLACR
jgi:hypothetical protein